VRTRFFSSLFTAPGAYPSLCTVSTGSSARGKAAEAWRWPPTQF